MKQRIFSDDFPNNFTSYQQLSLNSILYLNALPMAKVVELNEEENIVKIKSLSPIDEGIFRAYDIEMMEDEKQNYFLYLLRNETLSENLNKKICLTKKQLRDIVRKQVIKVIKEKKLRSWDSFLRALNYAEKAKDGKLFDKK